MIVESAPRAAVTAPPVPLPVPPPVPPLVPPTRAEASSSNLPRLTGWKNKLVFFTDAWRNCQWYTTDLAIRAFQSQLANQANQTNQANQPTNHWQGQASQLVRAYQMADWQQVENQVANWCREQQFQALAQRTSQLTKHFGQDLRKPDWWD